MPGKGRAIERPYTVGERTAIAVGAQALGMPEEDAFTLLGHHTYDVYLNDVVFWSNVPANVWEYTVGGYQVIKKWLSYRESDVLGRSLTKEEAREVTSTARRIAALLLMGPALDANYQRAKQGASVLQPAESLGVGPAA
jgi:Type ISP C-terminal specificity domain